MEKVFTQTEKIKNGEFIIQEGTWAFYAYVLLSGKANVYKNVHGKQVLVGALKKGDLFGEMSFLGGAKRTASVVADGDVEVGTIPRDTFMEAIEQLPSGTRTEFSAMVSDLTCMSEISAQMISRLEDIKTLKERMIDMKSFEKGIEKMPEILGQVAGSMAQRLNMSIEGCTHLATTIEEASKPVNALSVGLGRITR